MLGEAKTLIDGFLGQTSGTTAPAPTTGGRTGSTPAAQPAEMPTLEPRALIVADPRTNSLIVSAGPRDVSEIAALIARLDTPGASAEMKVFSIANGDATALKDMLSALFSVPAAIGRRWRQ